MRVAALVAGLATAALVWAVASAWPEPPASTSRAGVEEGRALFARMGCGSCHKLAAAGTDGPVGPDLDTRLGDHTRASLTAAIAEPSRGGQMPEDFGQRMTRQELGALADYLLSARR